ncbi:hypothetical protein [Curtobacterium ammoniigenes]|uniref:hypothetical protein n=1 Tax=Curtobacterium ammoniigenes TaxID=395387 RepID=UPI00082B619C|nr:hypothetical protein [Curtobacterium ammoniigenes]
MNNGSNHRLVRRVGVLASVAMVVCLTAGCGGAGSQVPNAKVPAASGHAADVSKCATASRQAMKILDGRIHNGEKPTIADVAPGDGGWYLAASATGTEPIDHNHVGVGLWAASSDPTKDGFSGQLQPLNSWANRAEQTPQPSATVTPGSLSAASMSPTSAAAKKATACMITDSRTSD